MLDKLVFFNTVHTGDVFVSRGVVRWMMNHIEAKHYCYQHQWNHKILKDFKILAKENLIVSRARKDRGQRWSIKNKVLMANVSYMVNTEYWKRTTLTTLLSALKGELKKLFNMNINITEEDIIPEVDYGYYSVDKINDFMYRNRNRPKVFVSNNQCLSGQAHNFNMDQVALNLAKKYQDVLFIVSNKKQGQFSKGNLVYASDLVTDKGPDLIECSYIGSHSNLILTRGSGPATFCLTKENMERRDVKFIGFCIHETAMHIGLNEYFENKFFNKLVINPNQAYVFSEPFVKSLSEKTLGIPRKKSKNYSVLFLGKKNDTLCSMAFELCKEKFGVVTPCFGEWGEPLPFNAKNWNGDLIISYLSRWIVPKDMLDKARIAAINFHPASPDYPGAGCFNFAIYERASEYGVTCHHMSPKVDSGKIIKVNTFPLVRETVESIINKTHKELYKLFEEIVNEISETGVLPESEFKWSKKPYRIKQVDELSEIKPGMTEEEIRLRIRATSYKNFKPFTMIGNTKFVLAED